MKNLLRRWLGIEVLTPVVKLEQGHDTVLIFTVDPSADPEMLMSMDLSPLDAEVVFIPRGVDFHKAIQQ